MDGDFYDYTIRWCEKKVCKTSPMNTKEESYKIERGVSCSSRLHLPSNITKVSPCLNAKSSNMVSMRFAGSTNERAPPVRLEYTSVGFVFGLLGQSRINRSAIICRDVPCVK